MAFNFSYRAKNQAGETVQAKIAADDIEAAKKDLKNQGLEVESIHLVFGSSAPPPTSHPTSELKTAFTKDTSVSEPTGSPELKVAPIDTDKAPPKVYKPQEIKRFKKGPELAEVDHQLPPLASRLLVGLIACLVLFALAIIPRIFFHRKPINRNIAFEVVETKDISQEDVIRKDYSVTVPQGIREEEIKYVTQKIYGQMKKKTADLSEATFHLFYTGSDLMVHAPIAVVRWNWEGSGEWEYSFSLDRAEQEDRVEFTQTALIPGEEVRFKVTLSNNITVDGAEQMVGLRLFEMSEAWKKKVKRIKAVCIYEDFVDPFMMCVKDLTQGESLKNIDCELIK